MEKSNETEIRRCHNFDCSATISGGEARTYQLNLVMDRVDELRHKYNCPAVIVGDFNIGPSSAALKSAYARGYVHAHDVAAEYADERNGDLVNSIV